MLQVIIEEEEEEITDTNNFTADTFSLEFSPQREHVNKIFVSENLENSNEIVNAVVNMRRNDVVH